MCPMICERLYEAMLDLFPYAPGLDFAFCAWADAADAATCLLHALGL